MDQKTKLLIASTALLATFSIALYARLFRVLQWGWWLDEFDPYIRYYLAKYTLENGPGWWWSGGHFTQFWWPYGVDWSKVLVPGTSFYGLFVYFILRPFGVDLWHAVVAAPAIMNALAVFSMFYLGYRLGQELGTPNGGLRVGLLAALLTAIMPAFMERGFAAWFDDEPISLFLIPLGLALLLEGLRRPWAGALSGVALGYVAWTWGAHFYIWNFVGLYAMVLPTYYYIKLAFSKTQVSAPRKKATPPKVELPFNAQNLFISYLFFYIVYLAFIATIPRYGIHSVFSAFAILPTFGLATTALVWILEKRVGTAKSAELIKRYIWPIVGLSAAGVAALVIAIATGLIGGKFLATILPLGRSAIVASVAEHTTTSFGQILARYGPILPFIIFSLPSLFTAAGFSILTYLVTAGYAAATMVRLLVLLAPAATLASAVGIVLAMQNKRLGFLSAIAGALAAIILLTSIMPAANYPNSLAGIARQPTQIATSAVGAVSEDFLDALMWLKTRLPEFQPVASWWDYGYWISIIGNKSSLADNSTVNATQIGKIGLALMSPPEIGAQIFSKEFNAKYILAIMPFAIFPVTVQGQQVPVLVHEYPPGGDFLKSYWMAKIALENLGDRAQRILGGDINNFDNWFYTNVMSYPGVPPGLYAQFEIGNNYYPVPLNLNRTLYAMLFSKVRLLPIYGNSTQYLPWIFEGVHSPTGFTTFRDLGLTSGNVYLPGQAPQRLASLVYEIKGWTSKGIEVIVDPLTGRSENIPYITAYTGPLRLVYVSKPYGWVVIYEIES